MRRPRSLAERQLKRWRAQWHASKTRELPLIDDVGDQLEAPAPAELETTLVHGDYHLSNVLVGPDGEVRAVLDWELCTVGDPLADVGVLLAYWNELGNDGGRGDALFRSRSPRCRASHARRAARRVRGRVRARPPTARFWVAFAYWKIAIIVEGVYRRWLNDPTNGTDAGTLQSVAPALAESAAAALGGQAREWSWLDAVV